jgi:hypothetical protein
VFGEKRTQKLSPGLIKDQHSLFYFFNRSLLSTTMASILIQYGGRMQISKIGLIFPYGKPQALVSFKKYMPPPLPYFKVNICTLPLPHFASIFFAYL